MTDWNALIRDVVKGDWPDPETGRPANVPFVIIRIEESLDGCSGDLFWPL